MRRSRGCNGHDMPTARLCQFLSIRGFTCLPGIFSLDQYFDHESHHIATISYDHCSTKSTNTHAIISTVSYFGHCLIGLIRNSKLLTKNWVLNTVHSFFCVKIELRGQCVFALRNSLSSSISLIQSKMFAYNFL